MHRAHSTFFLIESKWYLHRCSRRHRLFTFSTHKKFGYALPEIRTSSDVDRLDMNMINLTKVNDDEMEADAVAVSNTVPVRMVVKAESIKTAKVKTSTDPNAPTIANVAVARKERREMARLRKHVKGFAKKLPKPAPAPIPKQKPKMIRKTARIPDKESPLNLIAAANADSDMSKVAANVPEVALSEEDARYTLELERQLKADHFNNGNVMEVNIVNNLIKEKVVMDLETVADMRFINTGSRSIKKDEFDEDDIDIEPI
jgi:hypothetical protein